MRKSFEQICMNVAQDLSTRSTCKRLKVGCVITSWDYRQIYSWGYNGSATGLKHDCTGLEGSCNCSHAELSSLVSCTQPRQFLKRVFCTTLPCRLCSVNIINLGGVKVVYYTNEYRDKSCLKLFKEANIKVTKL